MSNWQQFVSGAAGLPQTIANQYLLRIQNVLDSVELQKKNLLQRVSDIVDQINASKQMEDLCACEKELIRLKSLQFDIGTEKSLDMMLESIKPRIQLIKSLPQTLEQLYALQVQFSCTPDPVFHAEISNRISNLEAAERDWVSNNIHAIRYTIDTLSAASCANWLEKTEVLPEYVSDKVRSDYAEIRAKVLAQLQKCRIDGVVTMFLNLSDDEKRKCLDIILQIC